MPKSTTTHHQLRGRLSVPSRMLGAIIVSLGLMATTSCTPTPEPEPVANPVKLLQNVHVGLSSAAGVETLKGNTISVSATGSSSSVETTYDVPKVLGELPVRLSTQYRAGTQSGSDLSDLQGHSGQIEIDLTLENLTVKPQLISYDAAGESRSETALVGAPLTIAAATTLTGVRADNVTVGSADGTTGTNGVLSSTKDGATVVQWATVLAPPHSGASTTLRLVADVKDFQVPAFDVAIQPGLNTDLTAGGVLAGAFSSGTASELELQRRTISLVSEVNTVLTQAGSTITDVRRNLQVTSQTLGVKTAGELSDNSKALAETMSALKSQLNSLGKDLETSTEVTRSDTTSQLKQTVSAVDALLGDTTAVAPKAPILGEGCNAAVPKSEKSATVYSSVLTMAAQLESYATVSADCRDIVAGALQATMGPEKPTVEECVEQGSMTCSLYGSAVTVTGALLSLAAKGDELVAGLQPQIVEGAIKDQLAFAASLEKMRAGLAAVLADAETPSDYKNARKNVTEAVAASRASLVATRDTTTAVHSGIDSLREQLISISVAGKDAKDEVDGGSALKGSMIEQNKQLAEELCKFSNDGLALEGKLSNKQIEQLRSYLTSVPCEPSKDIKEPLQELSPPHGFAAPMDERLVAQAAAWNQILEATDTTAPDQAIAQSFKTLNTNLTDTEATLDAIDEALKALDGSATADVAGTKSELEALTTVLDEAIGSSEKVGTTLVTLKDQQDALGEKIKKSLTDVSAETAAQVFKAVDEQVRQVVQIGNAGSDSVINAFNGSISGLQSTSGDVVADAKETVNKQRNNLGQEANVLTAALDKGTESSLKSIATSTSSSTRDVEGANALLSASLGKVMLDLGDRSVNGSGLLGAMATNAAKADTADYQLALAAQNAEGYANIRSRDVAGLLLRQAQFKASLIAVDELPPFHLDVPAGASSQTLYTLSIGAGA